jgi:hypothetical protein
LLIEITSQMSGFNLSIVSTTPRSDSRGALLLLELLCGLGLRSIGLLGQFGLLGRFGRFCRSFSDSR